MASSPQFKVYDSEGVYRAACKDIYSAAVLVAFYGDGGTIRHGHSTRSIVWREGSEIQSAAESYDFTDEVVSKRMAQTLRRW